MIPLSVDELAALSGGEVRGDGTTVVDAITTDSRVVPSGAPLFVALAGERSDGHEHAAAAVAAGAVAVMTERELPSLAVPMVRVGSTWSGLADLARTVRTRVAPVSVAVTGSVGKTTVKDLTAAAVGAGRTVHASQGSFNNELGVPLTLLGLTAGTEVLVAEVGARHPGDIAALAPLIRPEIAVVTAVAAVHLEVFGSIETVASAKAELVESLGPRGTAVLNLDDPRVSAMARRAPEVLGVGLAGGEVTARDVSLDARGRARATAVTPWGEAELSLPVAGRHHLRNGLFALAVAGRIGVDLEAAAAAVAGAQVSRWRGQVVDLEGLTVLDDAYNANPTSVAAALETTAAMACTGRRWAVLGVMAEIGPTAEREHEEVGRRAVRAGIDQIVAVGPGAGGIARGARAAGAPERAVHQVTDVEGALELVADRSRPGDLLLVKGSRVAGLERIVQGLRAGHPGREGAGA